MNINNNIELHYNFIEKSININRGKGSSAYYSRLRHPLRAWSKPYPETTGYLIPTLIQLEKQMDIKTSNLVDSCIQWLAKEVQHKDGAFPSLYADNTRPSLFNSAQIALGFYAYAKKSDQYKAEELKLTEWLAEHICISEKDIHYKEDFVPTYYSRVVWPSLLLGLKHGHEVLLEGCKKLLGILLQRIDKSYFPLQAGFQGDIAFTHTLAYTVRGIMESALLLEDDSLLELCKHQIDAQIQVMQSNNMIIAGQYGPGWEGDYSFRCLAGEWQWIIIFLKAVNLFNERSYLNLSSQLIEKMPGSGFLYPEGAVSGSWPFWGKYMPLKAPNWAAKFALDALLLYKKETDD